MSPSSSPSLQSQMRRPQGQNELQGAQGLQPGGMTPQPLGGSPGGPYSSGFFSPSAQQLSAPSGGGDPFGPAPPGTLSPEMPGNPSGEGGGPTQSTLGSLSASPSFSPQASQMMPSAGPSAGTSGGVPPPWAQPSSGVPPQGASPQTRGMGVSGGNPRGVRPGMPSPSNGLGAQSLSARPQPQSQGSLSSGTGSFSSSPGMSSSPASSPALMPSMGSGPRQGIRGQSPPPWMSNGRAGAPSGASSASGPQSLRQPDGSVRRANTY